MRLTDSRITDLKDKLCRDRMSFKRFHRDHIKSTGIEYADFLRQLNWEERITTKIGKRIEKYLEN